MAIHMKEALTAAVCAAVAVACIEAGAQNYPSRVVRFIIPDAAGGGMDTIGRLTAEGLSETLGRQVIVDNRPGAGTTLGIGIAAKAPPDGYTLLLGGSGFIAAPSLYRNLPFDPIKDFAPVTHLATSPQLVVVHPSLPARTIGELIKLAKAKPGAIVYASAGTGSSTFFATEVFKERAGVDLVHVPYRGGGQALTAVLSGETPVYFAPVAAAMPHLQSRLRAIGVASLQRLPMLPQVPTVAEAGFPGYEAGNSYGLMAPAGTPPEIIAVINRAALAALTRLNKRLLDIAYIPVGNRPDEYAAYLKVEVQKVAAIYQRLGLTPN
jgi:tripartite-type tricarboxylate transporter receptor subunit TctC